MIPSFKKHGLDDSLYDSFIRKMQTELTIICTISAAEPQGICLAEHGSTENQDPTTE